MSDPNTDAKDDFSHWREFQDDFTLGMDLIQLASAYANDADWHGRDSDEAYRYRHTF